MYYVQHVFASFLAPFLLFMGGRYSASDQLRGPLPYFGFLCFSVYMRCFLTPLSAMSWANLNHTLCAGDNDPWKAYFYMEKWYYLWSDIYLAWTSIASQFFLGLFATWFLQCRQFSIHSDSDRVSKEQIGMGFAIISSLGSFASYVIQILNERKLAGIE